MRITPTQQRNAVSEGLALGLALLGHLALPDAKARVDEVFAPAWSAWPYRDSFARVSFDVGRGHDGIHVMTRATVGKQTRTLYWVRDGQLAVVLRDSAWNPRSVIDVDRAVTAIDGDVPVDGWVDLARGFLDAYRPLLAAALTASADRTHALSA